MIKSVFFYLKISVISIVFKILNIHIFGIYLEYDYNFKTKQGIEKTIEETNIK